MSNPTTYDLIDALAGMVEQYLTDGDGVIQCDCVSASEDAIDILTKMGIIKNDRIDYDVVKSWKPKGVTTK